MGDSNEINWLLEITFSQPFQNELHLYRSSVPNLEIGPKNDLQRNLAFKNLAHEYEFWDGVRHAFGDNYKRHLTYFNLGAGA